MIKIRLARYVVLLLILLTLAIELAYLPFSLTRALTDGQIASSYPAVTAVLSYETYAIVVTLLRYLVTLLFWIATGLVFSRAGRESELGSRVEDASALERSKLEQGNWQILLATTLLLVLFPLVFTLGLGGADPGLTAPWGAAIAAASGLLLLMALLVVDLYYFIFPDGRFLRSWLRATALTMIALLAVFQILLSSGRLAGEWVWVVSMVSFFVSWLFGVGVLVYRYRKTRSVDLKHQIVWPVIALGLQPLNLLVSSGLGSAGWISAIQLWLQILLPAMIPLALLLAIYRRGLWGDPPGLLLRRGKPLLAWSFALVWGVGLGWFILSAARPVGQKIAFKPLPPSSTPRPVVIDTDMAPDDWMALLYLLQRPDIAVKAITVVGTGETHCEPGVRNALKLIRLAGAGGIPVACGRETPLQGNHAFPDDLRVRADTLNGMALTEGDNPSPGANAVDLLIQTIGESPEKVSLLALGPLTNLAEAVQRDPSWLGNLAQVYSMGGALKVEGNVGFFGIDNHLAEWNFYVDPAAVKIVLESGAPLTLVPLDATDDAPVDLAFFRSLQANHATPEARFVYGMLASQFDFIASGRYFFWDPLAAAVLADESLAEIKDGKMVITTEEGQRSGVTRLLAEGKPVRYAASADAQGFQAEFLRTLNQP